MPTPVAGATCNGAVGNCAITASPATLQFGLNSVTLTATDGAGNEATCTTEVTLLKRELTITCPAPKTLVSNLSCQGPVPDLTNEAEVTGGCGVITRSQTPGQLGLGETLVTVTATDEAGNEASCSTAVTLLKAMRVEFLSPLRDDNNPADNDNFPANVAGTVSNKIKRGQTVPHQVKVTACDGTLVTSGYDVRLTVQGFDYSNPLNPAIENVVEDANGLGADGTLSGWAVMVPVDGKWKFNLDTSNFLDPSTSSNPNKFYRSLVEVVELTAQKKLGEEDVILETK